MLHKLKINPQFYEQVKNGDKTFEIRYNDRGFQKNDTVLLIEHKPNAQTMGEAYTGRELHAIIGYVTNFGQKENYVVFSLLHAEEQTRQAEANNAS